LLGVAEPRELPDRPPATPVPRSIESAGVRELARPTDALEPRVVDGGRRAVYGIDPRSGERGEIGVALGCGVVAALPALAPLGDLFSVHVVACLPLVGPASILGRKPERSIRFPRVPVG